MIVRTWKAEVDPNRVEEFENFAKTISLPMFNKQPGCLGALFSRTGSSSTTFSFWVDQEAIDKLDSSTSYQETVGRIQGTGFLRGEPIVEVYPVFGGRLDAFQLANALR